MSKSKRTYTRRKTAPAVAFNSALAAADQRLAKAIVERAAAQGKLAALDAEIPNLVRIIKALGGVPQIEESLQTSPYQVIETSMPIRPKPAPVPFDMSNVVLPPVIEITDAMGSIPVDQGEASNQVPDLDSLPGMDGDFV